MDIFFSQILKSLDVVVDIHVAVRASCLDRVVNIDTLDTCNVESGRCDLVLHSTDALSAPYLSRRGVIKSSDDSGHPRNLADLLQSYGVGCGSVPSQCHFHK